MSDYEAQFARFKEGFETMVDYLPPSLNLEAMFERCQPVPETSIADARAWLESHRDNPPMRVERIALNECRGWMSEQGTGNIISTTGDFFVVEGVRVSHDNSREASSGWDQPIVTQIGFDGGILGMLRQRHSSVPHYLVEAKAEPGNPGIVQLSPTLQATFANLRRSHGGRAPHFAEFFNPDPEKFGSTLLDRWVSEDGGRLMNKRNRVMLVEVHPDVSVPFPPRFRWMTLFEIQSLLVDDSAFVSPHVRSLLSLL